MSLLRLGDIVEIKTGVSGVTPVTVTGFLDLGINSGHEQRVVVRYPYGGTRTFSFEGLRRLIDSATELKIHAEVFAPSSHGEDAKPEDK